MMARGEGRVYGCIFAAILRLSYVKSMGLRLIQSRGGQLYLQRLKGLEELENAMKTILKKMAHCEFYANIYRTTRGRLAETVKFSSPNLRSVFMNGMAEALPAFYASVIVFSIKAQLFFQASVLGKVLWLFRTSVFAND